MVICMSEYHSVSFYLAHQAAIVNPEAGEWLSGALGSGLLRVVDSILYQDLKFCKLNSVGLKCSYLLVTVLYLTYLILSTVCPMGVGSQFVLWFPATFLVPQGITSLLALQHSFLGGVEIRSARTAGWRLAPEHCPKEWHATGSSLCWQENDSFFIKGISKKI